MVLTLGDLIDGSNAKLGTSHEALGVVTTELSKLIHPVVRHMVGNNERRTFARKGLSNGPLGLRRNPLAGGAQCYEMAVGTGWRLVVLDAYNITMLSRGDGTGEEEVSERERAEEFLARHAPAEAPYPFPPTLPVNDMNRRFADNNGAFGQEQLDWCEGVLQKAEASGERVLVAGHNPVHPLAANSLDALPWDFNALRRVLSRFSCVKMYIAGHDHRGGYHLDSQGVHHLTVPGILEAEPDKDRYIVLDLYKHAVVLRGQADLKVDPGFINISPNSPTRGPQMMHVSSESPVTVFV